DGTKIAFSRYEWDGYKLALLEQITPVDRANMTYIQNYPQTIPKSAPLDTSSTKTKPEIYKPTFEKTYFLPRLAWDYGKFKPGFYAYTSDYIEKLNLFGGFAINGKADYDLYLSADYRQLPPVLFMDFYNIVRQDDKRFDDTYKIIGQRGSGATAEPIYATYGIKYKFTLYELDVGFRYNIDEKTVASLYTIMSRYNAALDFDDGTPAFGYTYFKGRSFVASIVQSAISRSITNDIHPAGGYQFGVKVQKAQNNFIEGFTVNAEKLTLQEVYVPYNYWQIDASFDYYYKWWRDFVVAPSAVIGYIDRTVDPFFHLYAGGLYGMRGYSFYSLGGTRTAIAQLKQQMPIWRPEGKKQWLGWIHPTDLYFNLFGDVGTAFRGDVEHAKWVRDAGAEIRFGAVSGYSFPTAISFAAARGLDRVTVVENNVTTVYDPDWRFYFTILFGFTQPPTGARTPSSVHNLSK
ncbi:MAG: hypothetical protein OEM52_12540, partial [bacterium]|nr:hypothetical protein [bacterium]